MQSLKRYKVKFTIKKSGMCIYLSQLDMQRLYTRVLTRAKLPVYYTQGFNPHPKMSYLNALKVGQTGTLELVIQFIQYIKPEELTKRIGSQLVEGLDVVLCEHVGTVG